MPKSWSDNAPTPKVLTEHAHLKDPISYKIKRILLGNPLNRHTLSHQRLKKRYALGILSSDCISSSAYGSEQILLALVPAFGLAAFAMLMPMTAIVLIILFIITLSYHNLISVYTKILISLKPNILIFFCLNILIYQSLYYFSLTITPLPRSILH